MLSFDGALVKGDRRTYQKRVHKLSPKGSSETLTIGRNEMTARLQELKDASECLNQ